MTCMLDTRWVWFGFDGVTTFLAFGIRGAMIKRYMVYAYLLRIGEIST